MNFHENIYKNIEVMEVKLSSILSVYIKENRLCSSQLCRELEWFITWRIKLEDLDDRMWCDGVTDLAVSKFGDRSVQLSGVARIGSENDVSKLLDSQLFAFFSLSDTTLLIESYKVKVQVNDKIYEMVKCA